MDQVLIKITYPNTFNPIPASESVASSDPVVDAEQRKLERRQVSEALFSDQSNAPEDNSIGSNGKIIVLNDNLPSPNDLNIAGHSRCTSDISDNSQDASVFHRQASVCRSETNKPSSMYGNVKVPSRAPPPPGIGIRPTVYPNDVCIGDHPKVLVTCSGPEVQNESSGWILLALNCVLGRS